MSSKKKISDPESQARFLKELQKEVAIRRNSYRERALKIYPHVCASCGREFSGRRLSELTVHHKDHNHDNNPPDGSNWELLCLYCHDHEHEKFRMKGHVSGARDDANQVRPAIFQPFADLDDLLKSKSHQSNTDIGDRGEG